MAVRVIHRINVWGKKRIHNTLFSMTPAV